MPFWSHTGVKIVTFCFHVCFYFRFNFWRLIVAFILSLFEASLTEIEARPNANVTLPCNVTVPSDLPWDESLLSVIWISNSSAIASFRNRTQNIKDGYSWNVSDFASGDFSLAILSSSLDLQGLYECKATYNATMLHSSNVTFSILGTCFRWWNWFFNLRVKHPKCFFLSQYPQLSPFLSSGWCWSRRTNSSAMQMVSTLHLSLSPGPGMGKTFSLPTPVKAIQPQMATTLLLPTWPYILPGRIRMWPLVAMSGTMAANRSYNSNLISHVSHFSQPLHEKGSGQGTTVHISLLRPCFGQTFSPTIALRQHSCHPLLRRGQFLSWGCFGDLPSKWHSPAHPTCHQEKPQRDL